MYIIKILQKLRFFFRTFFICLSDFFNNSGVKKEQNNKYYFKRFTPNILEKSR